MVVFVEKGNVIILYRKFSFVVLWIRKEGERGEKGIVMGEDKKRKLSFMVL